MIKNNFLVFQCRNNVYNFVEYIVILQYNDHNIKNDRYKFILLPAKSDLVFRPISKFLEFRGLPYRQDDLKFYINLDNMGIKISNFIRALRINKNIVQI